MKKNTILILLIIILALSLRLFKTADYPKTLYGDEQAFAWNAYNILKTGQDEYGISYPMQFKSFNDFKAPIPVYLLVPFFKILDMNIFSIRLPVVLASTITIYITYLLNRLMFNKKISLIIIYLFSISPWHIHLSRGYFEATLALLFFVTAIYFFLRSARKINYIFLSMLFFALTLYSYFTPRILLLIFIPFLYLYGWKFLYPSEYGSFNRKIIKSKLIKALIFLFILSLPLLYSTVFKEGLSRYKNLTENANIIVRETVNIERNTSLLPNFWKSLLHNKYLVRLTIIKNNYLEHLSLNFWYIFGDSSLRYFLGNMGMFYLFEVFFLIYGLYSMWKNKRPVSILLIGWILLAPIPASVVGKPFAVRSLAMLPAPFMIVGYGIYHLLKSMKINKFRQLLLLIIPLGFMISLAGILIRYYFEYPIYAATWWGWENKAAIDYAESLESKYENIFISDYYTGAPLAYAVYNKVDPHIYRTAINNPVVLADNRSLIKLGKYYFGSLDIDEKRRAENIIPQKSLYIGRPEEADGIETINAPNDNRVIFKIFKTN